MRFGLTSLERRLTRVQPFQAPRSSRHTFSPDSEILMPRVIHFEIHASEPLRLVGFYEELFDWRFEPWGPPGTYWLIRTGSAEQPGIDGGLLQRRGDRAADGQPVNSFVCTVDVPSAKNALARAQSLGGTVAVPVMAVPGIGWLGYLKDPDGNIVGLMQEDPSAA